MPDTRLLTIQRTYAVNDIETALTRCEELQHELAEVQSAYRHGYMAMEGAAARRGDIVTEHDRQAAAAEAALERLDEIGPVVGQGLAAEGARQWAREVQRRAADLAEEWQRYTAAYPEGAEA